MRKQKWVICLFVMALTIFSVSTANAEPISAESFVPKPDLRISMKGILGSDGTTYTGTLVTVRWDDDMLVTEAQEELAYYEGARQVLLDASEQRAAFRYVSEEIGISRVPIVAKRGEKKEFWLPRNVEVGMRWKTPWGNRSEIMEKNVTVETPAGRFEGCIVVEYDVFAGSVGIERHYIAPGVGVVKIVVPKGATQRIWYEVQRIEKIDREDARRIVGQLLER